MISIQQILTFLIILLVTGLNFVFNQKQANAPNAQVQINDIIKPLEKLTKIMDPNYLILVGTYSKQEDVQQMQQYLLSLNKKSTVKEIHGKYYVFLGEFRNLTIANNELSQLKKYLIYGIIYNENEI